jgi:hypothetical protein
MNSVVLDYVRKKIGKFPTTLLEITAIFFIVRGMLFYVGQRIAFSFSLSIGVWATVSLIIAAAGVLISFEYAGK